MIRASVALLLTVLLAHHSDVVAAKPTAEEQAADHNRRAREHFNLGQFRRAAVAYEQAYKHVPDPAFLFNMAQCYRRLGALPDLEKAAHLFEAFLRNAPADSSQSEGAKRQFQQLRKKIAQLVEQQRSTSKPKPKPKPDRRALPPATPPVKKTRSVPLYRRWWFWTTVGIVTAAATTAVIIGATSSDSRVPRGPEVTWSSFDLRPGGRF